jgi:hypothetical protein
MRFFLFLCFLLLLTGSCVPRHTLESRALEEPKICEALLLEELALRDTNRIVFVAFTDFEGKEFDPPAAVVDRLRSAGIPARNASESVMNSIGGVADNRTGEAGVVYSAGLVRWISDYRVEARRACRAGNLAGGASYCIMRKSNGAWRDGKIVRSVVY